LSRRLARRGLVVAGGAIPAAIGTNAEAAAVPPLLMHSTVKAALSVAANPATVTGVFSAKAVVLAEGVIKTMLLTKLKIAAAVLVTVAVLGAGAATLTQQVLAGKAADQPAPEKKEPGKLPDQEKKEVDPVPKLVQGSVKAVDAEKNTITVAEKEGENTYTVVKGAEIWIDGKPGKLADLPPGPHVYVDVTLAAEPKTALRIQARGDHIPFATVKSVDVEKNSITFEGPPDVASKTLFLRKDANIMIDGRQGKLTEVPPGAVLDTHLSVDQTTIFAIWAEGAQLPSALVKAVDAEKGEITFDDKAPAELAGKTFPVAKDAYVQIDGKPGKLAQVPQVPPVALVQQVLTENRKTESHVRQEWHNSIIGRWAP
jgi:hypothetical protein